MTEHFIKNIEIKNFKCFEKFKADGCGRVNLIGGKNNVGKTAFMEAVYINSHAKNIYNLTDALGNVTLRRDKLNFLLDNFRGRNDEPLSLTTQKYIENISNLHISTNIDNVQFRIEDEKTGVIKYHFLFQNEKIDVNIREFSYRRERIDNIKFLDNFGLSKKNIIDTYKSIVDAGIGNYIKKQLKELDNNITDFKFTNEILYIEINNEELPLIELGDGVRIFISIILLLYSSKGGYLFIDEVENGIHYSKLDRLWEIILTISKEQNVQVFATTHSKECIESYARVAKKLEDEEIGFIELGRNKKNELDSVVMNSEMFQRFINLGNEVRGW